MGSKNKDAEITFTFLPNVICLKGKVEFPNPLDRLLVINWTQ